MEEVSQFLCMVVGPKFHKTFVVSCRPSVPPLAGGGRYKFLQVGWLSPIHGPWATASKGPLREVEARALVLSINSSHRLPCVAGR